MNKNVENFAKELVKSTEKNWQKYKSPSDSDEILFLVLKAHLLVEEKLDTLIILHFTDENIIKTLNLNFYRKAKLSEAICRQYFGEAWWNQFLWAGINTINTTRNKLAHQLEPSDLHKRISDLITLYDDLGKLHEEAFLKQTGSRLPRLPDDKITDEVKLRSLISNILAQLDQLIIGLLAIYESIAEAVKKRGIVNSKKAMGMVTQLQTEERLNAMEKQFEETYKIQSPDHNT